jgi:hypothetical protein
VGCGFAVVLAECLCSGHVVEVVRVGGISAVGVADGEIRLSSLVLAVCEAHIIGIDIFTGKKCEDLCPTSHNMLVSGSGRSGRVAGVVC